MTQVKTNTHLKYYKLFIPSALSTDIGLSTMKYQGKVVTFEMFHLMYASF